MKLNLIVYKNRLYIFMETKEFFLYPAIRALSKKAKQNYVFIFIQ